MSAYVCVREGKGGTPPPDTSNGFFQDHMSFASAQQQYGLYSYSQVRCGRQTCCIIEGGRWKVEGIKLCVERVCVRGAAERF